MKKTAPSFTFIVPALNEEKNLPAVVGEIAGHAELSGVRDYEVIIIDDGSADATAAVAEGLCARHGNISLLRNAQRKGVGKSFLMGVNAARKDYCLIVPGDNEFDLDFFPEAVDRLAADGSHFIITYLENPHVRPLHRRVLSTLYIRLFNILFSTGFKYTNGIVIYPTEWIRSVKLDSGGYTFQSEALLKVHREGKRFVQIAMKTRPRRHGKSKIFSIRVLAEVVVSLIRMKREKRTPVTASDI